MAKMRYPIIVAALAASGLLASAASASDRHRTVEYSDLDLSSEAGQNTLKKRIDTAVRSVCNFPAGRTLADRQDQLRCETKARSTAMRKAADTIARKGTNIKIALD